MKRTIMTKEEWEARGTELFGENQMKWRFVCPSCGYVQSVEDFKELHDQGVDVQPSTAYFSCIGRWNGHMDNDAFGGKSPCNYAGGGLLRINPVLVKDGEREHQVFAFDEGQHDG